jgi:predicted Zn finger-like uncharacterized protein
MSNMRDVNCDNCSATYKISLDKIKKDKSRITCRRCQNKIVIYKSQLLEPQEEQAVVSHDDEKTLVDDAAPNPMEGFPADPQTAVSNTQPPAFASDEVSDPTIRKMTPPPVIPAGQRNSNSSVYGSINDELKPSTNASNKTSTSKAAMTSTSADRVQGTMKILAGVMGVGIVSMALSPFLSGIAATAVGALGFGALVTGLTVVITGDFGFVKPNMAVAAAVGMVAAGVMGGATFQSTPSDSVVDDEKVTGANIAPPPVEMVASTKSEQEEQKTDSTEKSTSSKSSGNASKTQKSSSTGTRNLLTEEFSQAKSTNTVSNTQERPSSGSTSSGNAGFDDVVEDVERPSTPVVASAEPKEDLDDDFDMDGFDDLGLDDEPEEKKGLFGRRDKEEEEVAPAPKPKAEPVSSGSGIPTSVLDIIIRNNKDVKGCYIQQRKETGSMPSNVKIMFTLQPVSGGSKTTTVSSAYIASGPYVGSKFEGCLRSAFKKMSFPSDNTTPQTLSYTLKL